MNVKELIKELEKFDGYEAVTCCVPVGINKHYYDIHLNSESCSDRDCDKLHPVVVVHLDPTYLIFE